MPAVTVNFSPARFIGGAAVESRFTARSARLTLPRNSSILTLRQTDANDVVLNDIEARVPGALDPEEPITIREGFVTTTRQVPNQAGRTEAEEVTEIRPVEVATVFRLDRDYIGPVIDLSGTTEGLALVIWGTGDPTRTASAVVQEGGDLEEIDIENVFSVEGAELDGSSYFIRRINNLDSVRRVELDFRVDLHGQNDNGTPRFNSVNMEADIRFGEDSGWRTIAPGVGLDRLNAARSNDIQILGDGADGGNGELRISSSGWEFRNSNFNPVRVTVVLPDFTPSQRGRGSAEIRLRPAARTTSNRESNSVRLESIKVVRGDIEANREDYRFQHRIGLNLNASSSLSGTPEAINAVIQSETFFWDPTALARSSTTGRAFLFYTDDEVPLTQITNENGVLIPNLPNKADGTPISVDDGVVQTVGFWSMNDPTYRARGSDGRLIPQLTDGAYRQTSNPASHLLTFALGQRETGVPGQRGNNSRLIYGLGLPVERIDLGSFTNWWEYCEENNLRFNGVFNENRTAMEIINALASVGHALLSWPNGRLSVSIDSPYTRPSYILDESNIVSGSFVQNFEQVRKYDGAEFVFFNEDNDFQEETIREEVPPDFEASGSIENVRLFGITNIAQARDYARRYIRHNIYRAPYDYEFRLPSQGYYLTIGDVVLVRHKLFGDEELHKLKVMGVSYSANEEVTIRAVPDGKNVWNDLTESVERPFQDFSTDLPLTINSNIQSGNFIELTATDGVDAEGNPVLNTAWSGSLDAIHDGQDFRLERVNVDSTGNTQTLSLGTDTSDTDYGRGVVARTNSYTGVLLDPPSDDDSDGLTWTFATPFTFPYQRPGTDADGAEYPERQISISRISYEPVDANRARLIIRVTDSSLQDTDFEGLVLSAADNQGAEQFRIALTSTNIAELEDFDLAVNLDTSDPISSTGLLALRNVATTFNVDLGSVSFSDSQTVTSQAETDGTLNENVAPPEPRVVDNRVDFRFLERDSVFRIRSGDGEESFTFTGFSYTFLNNEVDTNEEDGTITILSPNFSPESSSGPNTRENQLQRLIDANFDLAVEEVGSPFPVTQLRFENGGITSRVVVPGSVTSNPVQSEVSEFMFDQGRLVVSFNPGAYRGYVTRRFRDIVRNPREFIFRLSGSANSNIDSEAITPTNFRAPIGAVWSLFPNIRFTRERGGGELTYEFTGVEFNEDSNGSFLAVTDSLRVGDTRTGREDKTVDDYSGLLLEVAALPFPLTNPTISSGSNELVFRFSDAATVTQLTDRLRTSTTVPIGIRINGVTQPEIGPLALSMLNTRGNPLELEMSRYNAYTEQDRSNGLIPDGAAIGDIKDTYTDTDRIRGVIPSGAEVGDIKPRVDEVTGLPERVPLVIRHTGSAVGTQFVANAEARNGDLIRYLSDPIAGTTTRIGIPISSRSNIKTPPGAVYESMCRAIPVTSDHVRVLLGRGNGAVASMLSEIDRLTNRVVTNPMDDFDSGLYAIDFYRDPVQFGNVTANPLGNRHAIFIRSALETSIGGRTDRLIALQTLLTGGYSLVVNNTFEVGITADNTRVFSINSAGGPGLGINLFELARVSLAVGATPTDEQIFNAAATNAGSIVEALLASGNSAHIQIVRSRR